MKIAISIAVHENAEVVIDQINNINFFAPESLIVLHFSKEFSGWGKYSIDDFEKMDNVVVNPSRHSTSYATGILVYLHLSNFKTALKYDFDYFNLHSSNELFIKPGLTNYIKNFEAGFFQMEVNQNTIWSHGKAALRDKNLGKMMKDSSLTQIYGSQTEGTFYSRKIFNSMLSVLEDYISPNISLNSLFSHETDKFKIRYLQSILRKLFFKGNLYAKEEIYYATVAKKFAKIVGAPYTYLNWRNGLTLKRDEIDEIRADTELFIKNLNAFADDENRKYNDIFTVKRIQRRMDDPLRVYIRELARK